MVRSFLLLLLLWVTSLSAYGQQPPHSIFLQVLAPQGRYPSGDAPDLAPVRQVVAEQFTRMGYRVVYDRQEFTRLAAQQHADFIYADVLCLGASGTKPSVTLIVRDSLNNVWYTTTEDRIGLTIGASSSSLAAARHLVRVLPTTFVSRRIITTIKEQEAPQFLNYVHIGFGTYMEEAFRQPYLRRKLKSEGMQAELQIDSLGFPSLQQVLLPASLTQEETTLLQNLVLASPRWRPAYSRGRRVASTVSFSWGKH